ncbi:MAG: aminotransferase class I/II-fold pyridoxal phosphate-dependent enzyme, partial [Bacillota bacterium]|nr:aminotransferase class I/II-fold pyridoxal phosphate-dependent enzyme [Bacillota bacterium]
IFNEGRYEMDFEDLERKAQDPAVKLLLLCSPHNPVGRVWTRDELIRLGDICLRNNVLVIADEIHCDLVYEGFCHTPFASLKENFLKNSITCTAPSKTFNIAGLQISNLIIPDRTIRNKVTRELNISRVGDPNVFAVEALIAAYTEGEEWLQQLMEYLKGNLDYLCAFSEEHLPDFKVIMPQGTYLVWLDCSALKMNCEELNRFFLDNARVQINEGSMFGRNGEGFVRINIACPRALLEEGLNRIKEAVNSRKV